jgi:hypothetical protein
VDPVRLFIFELFVASPQASGEPWHHVWQRDFHPTVALSRNESTICCVTHGAAKGWPVESPCHNFQSSHHHAMSHVAIHVNRCQSLGIYHVVWEYCCSKAFSQLLAQFTPKIAVRRRRLILSNNRAQPHATCPLYLDLPHVRR